jgi:hypothetical protein
MPTVITTIVGTAASTVAGQDLAAKKSAEENRREVANAVKKKKMEREAREAVIPSENLSATSANEGATPKIDGEAGKKKKAEPDEEESTNDSSLDITA